MTRNLLIGGMPTAFTVLPPAEYDPRRTGGTVEMVRAGETRRIYLDLGRLPLDQVDLDGRDDELLVRWWEGAGA